MNFSIWLKTQTRDLFSFLVQPLLISFFYADHRVRMRTVCRRTCFDDAAKKLSAQVNVNLVTWWRSPVAQKPQRLSIAFECATCWHAFAHGCQSPVLCGGDYMSLCGFIFSVDIARVCCDRVQFSIYIERINRFFVLSASARLSCLFRLVFLSAVLTNQRHLIK